MPATMRPLLLGVIALPLALACGPVPEAEDASDDERPCRTQEDCEMAAAETGPRAQLCSSRAIRLDTQKDIAACGPLPTMTMPQSHEPRLACFHGTCVPVTPR